MTSPKSPLRVRKRTVLVKLLGDKLEDVSFQDFTKNAQQGDGPIVVRGLCRWDFGYRNNRGSFPIKGYPAKL